MASSDIEAGLAEQFEAKELSTDCPPVFQAPVFSEAARLAAKSIFEKMKQAVEDEVDDKRVSQEPEYPESYPALPGLFAFCFPTGVYGNEIGIGLNVHSPVESLCVEVFALEDVSENHLLVELISKRLRALGLEVLDEYTWEFQKDEHRSVTEWTGQLLALGLIYDPSGGNGCLFARELIEMGATNPAPKRWSACSPHPGRPIPRIRRG